VVAALVMVPVGFLIWNNRLLAGVDLAPGGRHRDPRLIAAAASA